MNLDPTNTRIRELSWRAKLTPAEEAELRSLLEAHPEAAAAWHEEAALNSLLEHLPNAPVPSNFTARVLQDIERADAAATRPPAPAHRWWQRILLPRLAFAAVLCASGLFLYQRNQTIKEERTAASLTAFGGTKDFLTVDVMQDFDSIAQLGPRIQPDMELLDAMK